MRTKEVIKEKGFTIDAVAKKLGKSISGMSQIVNNDNTPPKTLRQIADVIGCDITDFFMDEVNSTKESTPTLICPHCGKKLHIHLSSED